MWWGYIDHYVCVWLDEACNVHKCHVPTPTTLFVQLESENTVITLEQSAVDRSKKAFLPHK